ncbi:hypothetical protein BpHYR1_026264 [Brachionus plicatilis]|uniref:Uncharacterized protein n=1 Tax=Brachionus plicatilis TaxID=10195 RepID=A0A3M7QU00_BRAPC|nr:hypothetical protein BpHYR1_026264 [Brachionus plicatilis]
MITLNFNQVKKGLKQLFQCEFCYSLVQEPVLFTCKVEKLKMASFCHQHINESGYINCPVCSLRHKVNVEEDILFEPLEFAKNLLDGNLNLESTIENYCDLVHSCNLKLKSYRIMNQNPDYFFKIFFKNAINRMHMYMEEYRTFLDQELESLNEKIEHGFYKAVDKYRDLNLEDSSLKNQIKSKILEFNSEQEHMRDKFLSFKFTEKDLIQLQFLIVRLHSFNVSLSEEIFPDEYILETPSEYSLKKNVGFFVKSPRSTKDYDFGNNSQNMLFVCELLNLKQMVKKDINCTLYESKANDYLNLSVHARFEQDARDSDSDNFVIDTNLVYLDKSIETLKGRCRITICNSKKLDEDNSEAGENLMWQNDVEFNFQNPQESFKLLSANDLFKNHVYCEENDSIVIGMKILIDHIQLAGLDLSPKLEEFVKFVEDHVNNDPSNPENGDKQLIVDVQSTRL